MLDLLDSFLNYLWVKRSLEDDTPDEENSYILRVTGVVVGVLLLLMLLVRWF